MRYKGSEPERDGWSLLTIGADLEPLDDEELNQRLSAGCIGAAAESGASWLHNVVRGLGIAALNRVQIGGIEVSTVDPAEGKQINTICKGMLLTALGDDNISEGSCYLVSDLGTVERIENAGALLARMQGQGLGSWRCWRTRTCSTLLSLCRGPVEAARSQTESTSTASP